MIASRTRSSSPATGAAANAWRVEVFRRADLSDPDGERLIAALTEIGVAGVVRARAGKGYLLPGTLARADVDRVCRELLADPVLDEARITAPGESPATPSRGAQRILVSKKPGVMDPVALTVARALRRIGLVAEDSIPVATFQAWELEGPARLARATLEHIGREILSNEVIEDLHLDDDALKIALPPASPRHGVVHVALGAADDERLLAISRDGALSLSLVEMRAIRDHYKAQGREPTIAELETIAQTWSEHCKHKTFCGVIEFRGERIDNLLKHTIKAATLELAKPWCVSVFHDNAGVIAFDRGQDLAFKVETHNHPSALDPYGGAGTGVGGVIRDILGVGLGARPIANTDAFFVGPVDLPPEKLPKGCLHPRRILRGVVAGVRDYGNRMGIPTVDGGVWFHEGYVGNPLVYCGTVGILPHWAAEKSVEAGDLILLVGGRTGRDGIHGATFSSAELHEDSETLSGTAVQIGDAIAEKRVLDALLQARDRRLYRGVTDCGAGGLSSAVGEMAEATGAEVDLDTVPLKYPGLAPEEIWISEAQERMVLAVPPEKLAEILAVFRAEDCEATVIGKFVATGRLALRDHGEVVGDLDLRFLHDGTPRPVRKASFTPPSLPDPGCPAPASAGLDHARACLALLASPDIASKEWIVRQYDHEVQGMAVQKALAGARKDAPGDAAVLKPLPDSPMGAAIACGASPRYGALDPAAMALAAIDEALRNAVAVGGDPDRTAILDNFSWGNCDKEDRLGSLVLAAKACKEAALAYGTPFISGKDSLNNEYRVGGESRSIPPTLLISALAIVPDVARTVSMDLKAPGSRLYLVGSTGADLGGSHYLDLLGLEGGRVPRPDLQLAPKLLRAVHAAIRAGTVRACHDLSEGGLAVAAAEMAFGGALGLELDLGKVVLELPPAREKAFDPDATRLYSQSCSRFLIEVAEGSAAAFERALSGLPCAAIGRTTTDGRLRIRGSHGGVLVDLDVEELRRAFLGSFQG
ncbi:MAG TPA: phosphoribosylformylglycinamidine synthase subunit PurL [Planctomycetota bacterium]|jgi:phosphoribosylformylglycinamidine synthase|nr:phosphoribosylformylglycinamidine synthase subunit PurL [Planctomycetota bacterium]